MEAVQEWEGGNSPLPYLAEWRNRTCPQFAPKSIANTKATLKRVHSWGLPTLCARPAHDGKFILVGSSPYVTQFLPEIRELSERDGSTVWAINSAHNLMLDEGIRLDATSLFEGGPDNHVRKFRLPQPDVTYYIASHCHPHQYEALKDHKMVVWHALTDLDAQYEEFLKFPYHVRDVLDIDAVDVKPGEARKWTGQVRDYGILGGGATTFSRALNIGFILGYRDFDLFGFDSSFEKDGESHYVMSKIGADLPTIPIQYPLPNGARSKTYWCKAFMARQAVEVMGMLTGTGLSASPQNPWPRIKHNVRFHGSGLLPSWHRTLFPQMYDAD